MSNNVVWSGQKAAILSNLFASENINKAYFTHVHSFSEIVLGDRNLPIELIASYRQSSFVLHRRTESVIFFDVSQSFLLKNIFRTISNGSGYSSLTEILKQSGCLYVIEENYHFASFVFRHPIVPFTQYYLVQEKDLANYGNYMESFSEHLKTSFFQNLVDYFIVGHEIFHYLKHQKHVDRGVSEASSKIFDLALQQCCYENQENFEEIATYYGKVSLSREGLDKIRQDLRNNRTYFNTERERLVDEIECDWFSFELIANFVFKQNENIKSATEFSKLFFLIFSFFELQATIAQRFRRTLKSEGFRTEGLAESNFRKVALIMVMRQYIVDRYLPKGSTQQEIDFLHHQLDHEIFDLKLAIDNLYLMPTTNAVIDILDNSAKLEKDLPKGNVFEFHIKSLAERIIGRDEVFKLKDHPNAIVT
ncbi:hypothetical protein HRG84_18510 [Flavisolibacter sp. BT320]|nr:hypothetical protein [Flavisolibacter longurius]